MSSAPRAVPGLAVLLLAAVTAVTAVTADVAGAAGAARLDPQFALDAPAVTWSRDRVEFAIEQRGELTDRRLSVAVFVDGNYLRDYPTRGGRTTIVVEGLELEAGSHRLLVRSGTHQGRDRFRYLPPAYVAAAAAALAAVVFSILVLKRRKRRP